KIILIINKIDKRDARPQEVVSEVENLFLQLAEDDSSLSFTTLYAVGRDGKAFYTLPENYSPEMEGDLKPLFETIVKDIPNAVENEDKPFQLLISTLDYDNYVGKLCIGKVTQGKLNKGQSVALVDGAHTLGIHKVQKLYTTAGLQRIEVDQVTAGDIVTIAGIAELTIGNTVTDPEHPVSLPKIHVEEPTIKVTIGPNTSPFGGKEGKYSTSRQIKERLMKEKETNLGLKIEPDPEGVNFIVHGRGELHLAILIETMRREGFEMQVSKPQVIYKTIDGIVCEPYEEVTIDIGQEFVGMITEELGKRKGEMRDMIANRGNDVRLVYKISSQNLLGIRSNLLTKTKGTAILSTYFLGFFPKGGKMESIRNGVLIAVKPGVAMGYGLANSQERGQLFIGVGVAVYEGMIVGVSSREMDIEVNVCKEKKLTNNRSSGEGVSISVTPHTEMSLEQCLDFINDDEALEVTPINIRMRKRFLTLTERKVKSR
ncbi:MAG: EF-Tu/IF-2/RF-3 family GTPase, partial [bacterium]|nr:EF-Tu/IF-2/RF-3 family GTPase [bacterium]